jgi:ketosteroid isomerase-like protein
MVSRQVLLFTAGLWVSIGLFPFSPQRSSAVAQRKQPPVADEIVRIRSEWAKDLHAKQLDQLVALYASDAVFLKPSGERVTGRPAIRDLCKKVMSTFTSDITFQSLASDHSGELAYDSGEYRESLIKLSDETKANVEGNYVMIFKRQSDGSWLIAEQMWSLVTPSTE